MPSGQNYRSRTKRDDARKDTGILQGIRQMTLLGSNDGFYKNFIMDEKLIERGKAYLTPMLDYHIDEFATPSAQITEEGLSF